MPRNVGIMPRNVRNVWVDTHIDGRSSVLSGGPAAKDGGMSTSVKQRDAGLVTDAFVIETRVLGDRIVTTVHDEYGKELGRKETQR